MYYRPIWTRKMNNKEEVCIVYVNPLKIVWKQNGVYLPCIFTDKKVLLEQNYVYDK